MEFDADLAGMLAVANVLPSATVGHLVERLIDLRDRRASDPDFELGDMEPDDHLYGRVRQPCTLSLSAWSTKSGAA